MTKKALIIGYGRAGKRHGKILDKLGIEVYIYDPLIYSNFFYQNSGVTDEVILWGDKYPYGLRSVFSKHTLDFAVIATPPDLHLSQIRQCLDAGLSVLCEKPLCGLGQLAEAEALLEHPGAGRVMVAYNWRYSPAVIEAKRRIASKPGTLLEAVQYRELPEWGLLLDHCSHDLDILSFIYDGAIEVERASYAKQSKGQVWSIHTNLGSIGETVTTYPCGRRAFLIRGSSDSISLDPDPRMFTDMYAAFLSGNYNPGLEEAIKTQRLLERCQELANVNS